MIVDFGLWTSVPRVWFVIFSMDFLMHPLHLPTTGELYSLSLMQNRTNGAYKEQLSRLPFSNTTDYIVYDQACKEM